MFLFELLSTIPEHVEEAIRKDNIKVWYAKPWMYTVLFFVALKGWFPYNRALIRIAYIKYEETALYRERLTNFGEDFAKAAFVDNREDEIFICHITKREKIKAVFMPFNYIRRL